MHSQTRTGAQSDTIEGRMFLRTDSQPQFFEQAGLERFFFCGFKKGGRKPNCHDAVKLA